MTLKSFAIVMLSITAVACSKSKTENVGPRVSEGAYQASDGNAPVQAIFLKKTAKNDIESYALLSYSCRSKTVSSFGYSGISFSPEILSVPMVSIHNLSSGCDIESSAVANSNNSIKVSSKVNGIVYPDFILTKVDPSAALLKVHTVVKASSKADTEDEACEKVFNGNKCADLDLTSAEQN